MGGIVGLGYALSRAGLGAQVAYEKINGHVHNHFGDFNIRSFYGKVYGTFLPFSNRHFFLDLITGAGNNLYSMHRHISHGVVAKGRPHGWEWDGYGGIGYDFIHRWWRVTPLAAVQFIQVHVNQFNEHGAGTSNISFSQQNSHSLRSNLGISAGGTLKRGIVSYCPEIRGYWQHEFAKQKHRVRVSSIPFLETDYLHVSGGHRNYGIVGGKLSALFGKHVMVTGAYDYYWNNVVHTNLFYGELRAFF